MDFGPPRIWWSVDFREGPCSSVQLSQELQVKRASCGMQTTAPPSSSSSSIPYSVLLMGIWILCGYVWGLDCCWLDQWSSVPNCTAITLLTSDSGHNPPCSKLRSLNPTEGRSVAASLQSPAIAAEENVGSSALLKRTEEICQWTKSLWPSCRFLLGVSTECCNGIFPCFKITSACSIAQKHTLLNCLLMCVCVFFIYREWTFMQLLLRRKMCALNEMLLVVKCVKTCLY